MPLWWLQIIANLQRDRLRYEMVIVKQRKELYKLSCSVCELTGNSHSASRLISSPPSVLRTPVRGRTPPQRASPSFDRLLDLDESLVSVAADAQVPSVGDSAPLPAHTNE